MPFSFHVKIYHQERGKRGGGFLSKQFLMDETDGLPQTQNHI